MNRAPDICQTVYVDAGVLRYTHRGMFVPAEVLDVYPTTPHSRANPRTRCVRLEVQHANGERSQVAAPLSAIRRRPS